MAESEEKLKSFLMKVKEKSEKAGLKLSIQTLKTKIMASGPISSVQLLSCIWLFVTPWTTVCQASLSITNSWSPHKPMSIESVMPSNHLICRPLSSHLQSFPASGSFQMSQLFASGGQNIGVSASASVLPYCVDLHAVQGTLNPQFKSINSSALRLIYNPTLTSIHDHWKNHSLD